MRSRPVLILIATILVASAFFRLREPAVSDTGRATVIDGDSLEIGSTSIRLYGVDAPEGRQTCAKDGATWACGRASTEKLRELVDGHEITCREMDVDDYDRSVAVCSNGSVDLSAAMAAAGLALAYTRYSDDYVDEQDQARAARRGIWAGTFTAPWEWRRDEDERGRGTPPSGPADSRIQAPQCEAGEELPEQRSGCDIKGNINWEGECIYHLRGSRNYPETKIDQPGERWFCSVEEAERAGWRAPRG